MLQSSVRVKVLVENPSPLPPLIPVAHKHEVPVATDSASLRISHMSYKLTKRGRVAKRDLQVVQHSHPRSTSRNGELAFHVTDHSNTPIGVQ